MDNNEGNASPPEEKQSGRFGYTPVPSEIGPIPSTPRVSTPDAFGLVLSLGAVQPIWQLPSLFCYRGLWQDDRAKTFQPLSSPSLGLEVIITVATGSPYHTIKKD